jgi:geranylgeranyl transferase type-2 subunit beta
MMQSLFLTLLDESLEAGCELFTDVFVRRHLAYVRSKQLPNGGFAGRMGGADPYYTDFAVRTLGMLDAWCEELELAANYLHNLNSRPKDITDCFNRLNIVRVLGRHAVECEINTSIISDALEEQRLPSRGFGRKGSKHISAYNTFLGMLCVEMLGEDVTMTPDVATELAGLKCSDAGYCDVPGESAGQTNATAAALLVIGLIALLDDVDDATFGFLSAMQAPDGGLRAHAGAPESDLLSTFTAIAALSFPEMLDRIDLPAVGRFIKSTAAPGGGFSACCSDPEPDVEYTYYGLGTAALLRLHVAQNR